MQRGATGGSSYGPFLERLAGEIEEDRRSLLQIMHTLGAKVDRLKVTAARAGEKLGRLKPNGRLLSYSPLSRVVELETLALGVQANLALWRALGDLKPGEPRLAQFDLAALIARAEHQRDELEAQRKRAAAEAFA